MHTIELFWTLQASANTAGSIERHCKNCGKTVRFTDTNIRRHNANGKNVYRFSIYKCEKGHTWNKKLAIYKSFSEHAEILEEALPIDGDAPEQINISDYLACGIKEVKIIIDHADGRFRIDKLLAEQLVGWSRTQIAQRIKAGLIRLNDQQIKPGVAVSVNDRISILIE
ncbi:S4 domain-containing protein [Brevibacillus ruminantium]|uniref:S4 domain-containing protein n=1 Tax=Brevibacillus ruminantium TaxID=2950604 RepID=A0ABY4WK89_9BACL|nr:S4 domain-containing protein [Brevibacillus ruminantium]USG66563.1 S4 domain-containing protein [Brevibacillus ruminantium]